MSFVVCRFLCEFLKLECLLE